VSSYVARFERRGHVERVPSVADGRSYRVALTPAGRAAHERAGVEFLGLLDRVEGVLGEDRIAVQEALRALRAALGRPAGRGRR
jgi:DNA-binding MarR family transcriptional regulator